jgi:protein TonB
MTLIGLAAAMILAGAPATGPTPRGSPGNWIMPDDYPHLESPPPQSLVGYRLDVGADGHATGCTIVSSSGSPSLDSATCQLVARRARFVPAADAAGTPVAGTWSGRVHWASPD